MLYDIEQVASKLNVSKQTIYNKIKLNEFKNKIVKKQGKTFIDEELLSLIQDSLKMKCIIENDSNNKNVEVDVEQEIAIDTDTLNLNKELSSALLEQLKAKDVQLSEKDMQIKGLINRLQQEQELHQNTQILLKTEQHRSSETALVLRRDRKQEKKKFWERIFRSKYK